jgi:hypothetical protein
MFRKHRESIVIKNYRPSSEKHFTNKIRNPLAPVTPTNILISGHSGCGKTNLLLNLIYDLLFWDNLYIYAKDLEEHLYVDLVENCEKASSIEEFDYEFENDLTNAKSIDEMDRSSHNLVVFDDFCTDAPSMNKIKEYFIRGRKMNCTCIFISQDYFSVPKIIRLQCSYFCMFKSRDDREILDIHKTHNCGMTKDEFKIIFKEATSQNYNFLCIDKRQPACDSRSLRRNFDFLFNFKLYNKNKNGTRQNKVVDL